MCRDLPKFIAGQSHAPPCCVVYDSLFPWVLGTARELGIMAAPFFTQPAAVNAVYMNLMKGRAAAEGFPVEMEAADLPSFVTDLQTGSQASITQWLDSKPLGSIIYASLGSLSDIPESQIVELANALHLSNHPFIWVVRASEQDKLPPNFTSNNATCLIVDWCHQLEILAHPSVGCFVTHCGWNSTIEAISIGVPMVTLPVWVDQPTNAKFVGDLWRVGARANANITSEVVTRDEIRRGIKEVMEGESGEEIRRNVEKWKRSAHEAVADGGSSSRNINEFVTAIKNRG
ncbi:UDP-glycosyltransferase 74E1 [Linum perenne]